MAKLLDLLPFDYDQVRLVPGYCVITSRSEVDPSVTLGSHTFKLPVVPANMSTIVDEKLAHWLATEGYFYVMHRFDVDPVEFTQLMQDAGHYASISVGVKEQDFLDVRFLAQTHKPEYITVDIAHSDAPSVVAMVQHIKTYLPDTYVIAGNVATPEGVKRLESAGADCLKVGIGPGAACLSSPNTGFGTRNWQLSALEWCAESAESAQIIADGGIRELGDVAKSIAFGADMVMIGGMFAAHSESPGELIEDEHGNRYKIFFGSASEHQKGEHKFVEGTQLRVPYKGPINDTLRAMTEALQSSVSYAGGRDLSTLADATYVILR